jgi:hypothetical protein
MTDHIELRLPYHRNVYVARICGRSRRYRLERDFHCVRRKREIADYNDGRVKWRVVYHLPLIAAVCEVRDDQDKRYYIGTRPGDPALYEVTPERIEALLEKDPDIDEVIGCKVECLQQPPTQNADSEAVDTAKVNPN